MEISVHTLVAGMRVLGEQGPVTGQIGAPVIERLFSLQALFDILGAGLLTIAFIVPMALLAEWYSQRRDSDNETG